jgi:hypothetical protein
MNRWWRIRSYASIVLALGVSAGGCGGERSKPPERPAAQSSDTVAMLRYEGVPVSLTVPLDLGRAFAGFQHFLDSTRSRPSAFATVRVVDVTGDGNPDTCRAEITGVQGGILVVHRIRSRGSEIWLDTMTIDHEAAKTLFWHDDSSYSRFGTSILYHNAARYYTDFVGATVDTSAETFKNMVPVFYTLERHGEEREYWQRYLSTFRGRFIEKLDLADVTPYLWDARTSRFILFYAP